jgi:hypothetical protein
MITEDQIAVVIKQVRHGVTAGEIKTQLIRDRHSPEAMFVQYYLSIQKKKPGKNG